MIQIGWQHNKAEYAGQGGKQACKGFHVSYYPTGVVRIRPCGDNHQADLATYFDIPLSELHRFVRSLWEVAETSIAREDRNRKKEV